MKIIFMTRVLPVHASGGMQQHAETVINYLKERHKVTVITTARQDQVKEDVEGNLDIIYLENTLPGKYYGGWWKQSGARLKELLSREDYDAILSESVAAFSFFKYGLDKKYNIPVFSFCPGFFPKEIRTTLRKKIDVKMPVSVLYKIVNYFFIDIKFYPRLAAILAKSRDIMEYFKKKYPARDVRVIYNGIDINNFMPRTKDSDLLGKYGLNAADTVLLNVGRLEKEKGIDNLIAAFNALSGKYDSLRLVLAGDGDYEKTIRNKVEDAGMHDRIKILGRVSHDDLPAVYNMSDIFIFPSLCDEGLPHVILEAMASGLPVISTKYPGIEDIIEDGMEGLLYNKDDEKALAEKIEFLIKSPRLAETMKDKCRNKALKKFSLENIGGEIEEAIRSHIER
ncbi:glycosyltransferase family 4 protein [Elusimicrobiota bacterium]